MSIGGDAVSGGGTVIEAINAGKVAAKYIDKFLRGEPVAEDIEDKMDYGRRQPMPVRTVEERADDFEAVELGYTLEQVTAEADRCLRCHRPILVVS